MKTKLKRMIDKEENQLAKKMCKKIIIIITIFVTLILSCFASPSYASKLKMGEDEFYYAGTTKGSYVPKEGIFDWLLDSIGQIADWLLGLITMGFRMVVVGWTALFEQILTWTLNSTVDSITYTENSEAMAESTGTTNAENISNADKDGSKVMVENISTTSVEDISNSNDNLTVEAMVYNQVPIFNINVFDTNYDFTRTGTGQRRICENCGKYIVKEEGDAEDLEICTCVYTQSPLGENQCDCNACLIKTKTVCTTCGLKESDCQCESCSCEACTGGGINNAVTLIKQSVAQWYYIIRVIAIAAMLVVLIGIGIKMTLSTVASDRAVYKRMLVDWLIGMIILFSMHYLMILFINMNESLVNVMRNASPNMKEITQKEYNIEEKSDSDLEIGIYEATRTRAYDPKLSDGTIGMIMYATLVYMACKYGLIYLKRYLTIIVLTLMAPGVALGYAFQKALTGKSPAFSKWASEYFLNCIIQTVHAIVYTVFISTALTLSLESVVGMIIALIIMNYMAKFEKIFRKIFKMSSEGGIADEVEQAGSLRKLKDNTIGLLVAARPLAQMANNSLPVKVAKGIVKNVGSEGVLLAARTKAKWDTNRWESRIQDRIEQNGDREEFEQQANALMMDDAELPYADALQQVKRQKAIQEMKQNDGKEASFTFKRKQELEEKQKELLKAAISGKGSWQEYAKITKEIEKALKPSSMQLLKAHLGNFLDVNHYYTYNEQGKRKRITPFLNIEYDKAKKKYVINSTSQLVGQQLKAENLLGFTETDKKLAQKAMRGFRNTLVGFASLGLGMGTFVTNPDVGLPLLAVGMETKRKVFARNGRTINGVTTPSSGKYTWNSFSRGSMRTMGNEIKTQYNREKNKKVKESVEKRHPGLAGRLMKGGIGVTAIGTLKNTDVKPLVTAAAVGGATFVAGSYGKYKAQNLMNNIANGIIGMDDINKEQFKQLRKQEKSFKEQELKILGIQTEIEYQKKFEKIIDNMNEEKREETVVKSVQREIDLGNAIKTKQNQVLFVRKPVQNEKDIIENAIAQVAVSKNISHISELDVNNEATKDAIKKIVAGQMIATNHLQHDFKIDMVISNIDKKILDTKAKMDKAEKPKESHKKIDQAILVDVITEVVQKKQEGVMNVQKLPKKAILNRFEERKWQMLQNDEKQEEVEKRSTNPNNKQKRGKTKKSNFSEETQQKHSAFVTQYLKSLEKVNKKQQADINIYKNHKTQSKTEKEQTKTGISDKKDNKTRRSQKLKQILALAAKEGEDSIIEQLTNQSTTSQKKPAKMVAIEQEDVNKVVELLLMQKELKEINLRGNELKMTSVDPTYNRTKKNNEKLALERYQGDMDGSKSYTEEDIEIYGPVTNVINLIKKM